MLHPQARSDMQQREVHVMDIYGGLDERVREVDEEAPRREGKILEQQRRDDAKRDADEERGQSEQQEEEQQQQP